MLPENSDTFFEWYHDRVYSNQITLSEALIELRESWKVYPERRVRIEAMAKVVQIGMLKKPAKIEKADPLEQAVMETLL